MRNPLVSVVVPLYNKGELVQRAIESVLCQTFGDFEIIVVDDCSIDAGPERVREFSDPRILLLKTDRNSGPSATRDMGIRSSNCKLVAFLDADDEWMPCFLEKCVGFMESHPGVGLVATGYEIREKGSRHSVVMDAPEEIVENPFGLWRETRETFYVCTSAILIRRKSYLETGGFDPRLRVGEDVNLWIKMAMRYPIGYIPQVLAVYHLEHPNRESASWFLGKPRPWIFSDEFMPVPEEFKKSPAYESFVELRAIDAERYMRTWLSLGRLFYARRFARQQGIAFWRFFFLELRNLARNLKVMLVAWLKTRKGVLDRATGCFFCGK